MKLVPTEQLSTRPRECIVTGRTSDPVGFVDTGNVVSAIDVRLGRGHLREVDISVAAAKEIGRTVGMVTADEVADLGTRLAHAEAALIAAHDQIEALTERKHLNRKIAEYREKNRKKPAPSDAV